MKRTATTPKYLKIALDIAYRIYNQDLKEGAKISGRSTLAGEYNVSPETIRRAVALLRDMNVVRVNEKSGICIGKKEQANAFIEKFNTKNSLAHLKKETNALIMEKKALEKKIEENIQSIIEYAVQLRNVGLVYPFETIIPSESPLIGKTIGEINFWHNTKATIIGVKRNNELLVSPGPYLDLREDDVILFVGNEEVLQTVENFISPQE